MLFFGAIDITNTSVIRRAMSRMAVTKPLNLVPGELAGLGNLVGPKDSSVRLSLPLEYLSEALHLFIVKSHFLHENLAEHTIG